jgi:hypothetical protein
MGGRSGVTCREQERCRFAADKVVRGLSVPKVHQRAWRLLPREPEAGRVDDEGRRTCTCRERHRVLEIDRPNHSADEDRDRCSSVQVDRATSLVARIRATRPGLPGSRRYRTVTRSEESAGSSADERRWTSIILALNLVHQRGDAIVLEDEPPICDTLRCASTDEALRPHRREVLQGTAALGLSALVLPAASVAASVGPLHSQGATQITWSDGSLFDVWSERTTTESDLDPTRKLCWQPFQAHVDLHVPRAVADALGVATYFSGSNSWFWNIVVSGEADVLGAFGPATPLVTQTSVNYEAGGFTSTTTGNAAVSIPAGHYFMLGLRNGPLYRAFRELDAPRTAIAGGVAQFTALNRVYYGPDAAFFPTSSEIPRAVGGESDLFVEEDGVVAVISLRLQQGFAP